MQRLSSNPAVHNLSKNTKYHETVSKFHSHLHSEHSSKPGRDTKKITPAEAGAHNPYYTEIIRKSGGGRKMTARTSARMSCAHTAVRRSLVHSCSLETKASGRIQVRIHTTRKERHTHAEHNQNFTATGPLPSTCVYLYTLSVLLSPLRRDAP